VAAGCYKKNLEDRGKTLALTLLTDGAPVQEQDATPGFGVADVPSSTP
jgi:hypothetical protein